MTARWSTARRVAGIATTFTCLLSSAIVLFFWIRSYSVGDAYRRIDRESENSSVVIHDVRVMTGQGAVIYDSRLYTAPNADSADELEQFLFLGPRPAWRGYRAIRPPIYALGTPRADSIIALVGFRYLDDYFEFRPQWPGHQFAFGMPFWALFLLTGGYPLLKYVLATVREQRQERLALGLCPTCGLAIQEDDTRCPGCNRKIVPNT